MTAVHGDGEQGTHHFRAYLQFVAYVSGKHYVTATLEEMPGVIDYYLKHPEEREAITEAAHR